MEMNFTAVQPVAPSTHPALELIALAQLSPENARQRLRALLLANPKYFGNVPPTSFNAVLNIQEDTTYECISSVACDANFEQLRVTIDIRQAAGYSGAAQINCSEEFVRFYVSCDGGATWLDQGMRSVKVSDTAAPRMFAHELILKNISADVLRFSNPKPKVRAILSWNSPPPAGAPYWTPVWGNVVESDLENEDVQANFRNEMLVHPLPSSKTDLHHQFLNYLFAKAAWHCGAEVLNPTSPKTMISPMQDVSGIPSPVPTAAAAGFGAAL